MKARLRKPRHGKSKTISYKSWWSMIDRCTNAAADNYSRYGGKGIKVCDRWLNSFEAFCADVGQRPSLSHSIDRIDSGGDYEPGNCRWATKVEQQRNRAFARIIQIGTESRCVAAWCELSGLSHNTLLSRINRGWPPDRLLSPTQHRRPRCSLSSLDVTAIRSRVLAGESAVAVARDFGIRSESIYRVLLGKSWAKQDRSLIAALVEDRR